MRLNLIFIALIFSACSSTQKTVQPTVDEDGNLVGIVHKADFQQSLFQIWFEEGYNSYMPNSETVNSLKPLFKNIEIKAVMGTWCSDSRREVPHFYKILDESNVKSKKLTMIAVDRTKNTPTNETGDLNITRVPTFIFYKNGVEINRIVEYPIHSLEEDMLQILSGKTYKHAYLEE